MEFEHNVKTSEEQTRGGVERVAKVEQDLEQHIKQAFLKVENEVLSLHTILQGVNEQACNQEGLTNAAVQTQLGRMEQDGHKTRLAYERHEETLNALLKECGKLGEAARQLETQ